MLIYLAQAAPPEPPPAGWTATADSALRTASTHQDVLFPLLAVASPFAIVAGLAYVFIKYALPAWQAEKALDRAHADERLKAIRADCSEDLVAARALAAAQHESIVQRVEGRIERQTGELQKLSERSEKHGEVLRSIAQKLAVGLLLVLVLAGAVIAGRSARVRELAAGECTAHPCATGYHCCGQNKCCKDTGTAGVPHTELFADRSTDAVRDN